MQTNKIMSIYFVRHAEPNYENHDDMTRELSAKGLKDRELVTDFSYKLSDGESLGEVQERNIAALDKVLEKYHGKNIVIGSHGTALSTIINYYDKAFGYVEFEQIRGLMPWVVQFTFEDKTCIAIEQYNLFTSR